MTVSCYDPGDMRAMAVGVIGRRIASHEAFAIHNPRAGHVGGLQIVVLVNTAINDGNSNSTAINSVILARARGVYGGRGVVPFRRIAAVRSYVCNLRVSYKLFEQAYWDIQSL